jgi:hypothetical protein
VLARAKGQNRLAACSASHPAIACSRAIKQKSITGQYLPDNASAFAVFGFKPVIFV